LHGVRVALDALGEVVVRIPARDARGERGGDGDVNKRCLSKILSQKGTQGLWSQRLLDPPSGERSPLFLTLKKLSSETELTFNYLRR
jgi:hypothetical protein